MKSHQESPQDLVSQKHRGQKMIWHPFTQMKVGEHDHPLFIERAEGSFLFTPEGHKIFDGISSWWTCIHGHSHPKLTHALASQAAKLDHVMFAGFTHDPAIELCSRLHSWLPQNLSHCFFSDDGSTAVEVALKMAFQGQQQRGLTHKYKFGALHHGYHGDTLGAVGVGEPGNFYAELFSPLLLKCERLSVAEDPRRIVHHQENDLDSVLELDRINVQSFFAQFGNELAGFILEPLIQCAGGMRMWCPETLEEIRHQCDQYDVFLIADEIATGFGRTGTFLALDQTTVQPDILCLSKGLTSGVLPLSMTWATDAIYDLFLGTSESGKAFLHGHSFTGNPIACSVANASLKLFDEEPVLHKSQTLSDVLRTNWGTLSEMPQLTNVRTLGTIGAANFKSMNPGPGETKSATIGQQIHRKLLKEGILVRPIGTMLYLMPPLSTQPDTLKEAIFVIKNALKTL